MAIDALVLPLLKIDLFHGLRPLQITEIARHSERIVFRAGQTIVEAGAEADAAYVIVGGEALRTAGPHGVGEPEPIAIGSLICEMAMLVDTEYSSTVIAKTSVRALRITRQGMHGQLAEDPALAEHLVAKITSRLKDLAAELRAVDRSLAGENEDQSPIVIAATQMQTFGTVRPGLETQH